MKIESNVLKDYCLTIDSILRYVGPSFDIDFIFYNTILELKYAVTARCLPNLLDTKT